MHDGGFWHPRSRGDAQVSTMFAIKFMMRPVHGEWVDVSSFFLFPYHVVTWRMRYDIDP